MNDILILISVLVVVIGVITLPKILNGGKEGQETSKGAVLAIVGLVAFFGGSYLFALFFGKGLETAYSFAQSLHIPFPLVLCSPIILIGVLGYFNKFK